MSCTIGALHNSKLAPIPMRTRDKSKAELLNQIKDLTRRLDEVVNLGTESQRQVMDLKQQNEFLAKERSRITVRCYKLEEQRDKARSALVGVVLRSEGLNARNEGIDLDDLPF